MVYTSMTPSRVADFDFSRPFGEEKWMIMMSRPQETTDGDGLIAPFQPEVKKILHYFYISLFLKKTRKWLNFLFLSQFFATKHIFIHYASLPLNKCICLQT